MPEIELFDGTVLEFPEGTARDVMDRVAKQQTAARRVSTAETAVRGIKQGFTGNFGDEMQGAAAASPLSPTWMLPGQTPQQKDQPWVNISPERVISGAARLAAEKIGGLFGGNSNGPASQAYDAEVAAQRQRDEAGADQNPVTSVVSNIAGAVANPLTRAAPLTLKGGAATGAATGAIYGAGDGTDLASRVSGAGIGSVVGGALGGATGQIGKMLTGAPSPATTNAVVEAGQRLNVPVPGFIASDSKATQMAAQAGRQSPFGGPKLEQAAQDFVQGVGGAAERTALSVGSGDVYKAGETASDAIKKAVTQDMPGKVSAAYKSVDSLINPNVTTDLAATRQIAGEITASRMASHMPDSGAVNSVMDALNSPGLTYDGIKNLRTSIGEALKNPSMMPQGTSNGELKQIYSALTKDLESAVANAGGTQALTAFKQANTLAKLSNAQGKNLQKIVGVNAELAPEKVFDKLASMATNGTRADLRNLKLAQQVMPRQAWDEVTSAVVNKLGRATPDAEFSADRFVTQWAKLSDEGKKTLFGSNAQLQQALEDISTLAAKMKTADKFKNTSNTGRVGVATAFGAGFMAHPIAAISAAVGSDIAARVLSRPVTAQSAAKWAKIYAASVTKPSAATTVLLQRTSRQFGATIANELGIPQAANDIGRRLMGPMQGAAGDNQQ